MSTDTPTSTPAGSEEPAAPPAPETPANPAAEPAAEAPVAQAAAPAEEEARPRLNPTAPDAMRPIPTLDPSFNPEPAEASVAAMGIEVPMPHGEKTEVPRDAQLDESMEAEINAALAGVPQGSTRPPAEGEDAPPAPAEDSLKQGRRMKAKVVAVHGESVLLDLGVRANGILSTRNFEEGKVPEAGATLDVVVDKHDPAEGVINVHLARGGGATKPAGDWNAVSVDMIVDCMVTKTNKGGLEVTISNLRGFLPASQVDYGFVQNLEQYVGQKLRVKVTEVNPSKRNLIVSRRAFLETERAAAREQTWANLQAGQVVTGTVKTLKDYGAFIDIGGVDGLLHVGEMSWTRVNHPKDVLQLGQQVEVKILSIDREKMKVSLGMKELQANPWSNIESRYAPKTTVHGRVTKITEFGAFVQLEPGVEGLIHISELDHKRVHRVSDVLKVDQEIDAQVLTVDTSKKRIALSLKALTARPEREREAKPRDEDLAPSGGASYERRRRGPLKGGGTGSGGFSFGS